MKVVDVSEAAGKLSQLIAEASNGKCIVLRDGDREVELLPHPVIDPEIDSPELEAELLKGVQGPLTRVTRKELREEGERIIREMQKP